MYDAYQERRRGGPWGEVSLAIAELEPRAALSVPIDLGDGPIGTLDLYATNPRGWDHTEVCALQSYAGWWPGCSARRPRPTSPGGWPTSSRSPWPPGCRSSRLGRADAGATSERPEGRCCTCCERALSGQTVVMRTRRPPGTVPRSAFAGLCFPPEVIVLAVCWYLRFGLSFREGFEPPTARSVGCRRPSLPVPSASSRACSSWSAPMSLDGSGIIPARHTRRGRTVVADPGHGCQTRRLVTPRLPPAVEGQSTGSVASTRTTSLEFAKWRPRPR